MFCVDVRAGRRYRLKWVLCVAVAGLLGNAASGATSYGLMVSGVMSAYGFGPASVYGRQAVFRNRSIAIVIETGSRRVVFDGLTLHLNSGIARAGDDWLMAPVDAVDTLGTLLFPARALKSARSGIVVLDPGHGGDDPGAMYGRQAIEKKVTLDIAQRVSRMLRDCRVDCRLTRDRDTTLNLDERSVRGRRLGADAWVSIHLNASSKSTISGIETYVASAAGYPSTSESEGRFAASRYPYCPGNATDGANLLLAYSVHKGVVTMSRAEDRGIRRARFAVLRNAPCPATLVECGFLSNPSEQERILDPNYRNKLAEGVARGILTYLTRVREVHLPPVYAP